MKYTEEVYKKESGVDLPHSSVSFDVSRIQQARSKLLSLGTDAFPLLLDHLDDTRYSYSEFLHPMSPLRGMRTLAPDQVFCDKTVGRVCLEIIREQVGPSFYYKGESSYVGQYLFPEKRRESWWANNKGKSLKQLRIQALQWTIRQEERRGLLKDLSPYYDELKTIEKDAVIHRYSPGGSDGTPGEEMTTVEDDK